MTPQEQLLLQQQQKMAGYPTSDKPAIFPPDNGGQQAAAHPRANMFANWGQNGQGNWAKTANPTASQWVDQQKKSMNIGQNANPEPVAAPYAPGTKVVQQPAVQQTENTQKTQVNQPITSADDLARAMGYTSPEEEDRLRKASVANQRIMAVADALRHIGNIANTVGYAPSQQFNSPVEMERQRYLQGKALRDKANLTYINYQQAKAAQDAKQRQWEAEQKQKADQWNATFRYNAARDAARLKNAEDQWRATLGYRAKNDDANRAQRQKQYDTQNALRRQSIGIQAQNSKNAQAYRQWKMNGGGSGGKGGTLTFRGTNGFYSKRMSAQEANAFYNQAFEELSKMKGANGKPIIDQNAVAGNIIPSPFGGNKINMAARKEAVDKAIYQHPEAGKFLEDKFEFELDPRGVQQAAMPTTQYSSNIKFGPEFWNSQKQQGSGYGSYYTPDGDEADDDEEDMFRDDDDLSGISF